VVRSTKKLLPDPGMNEMQTIAFVAPRNEMEEKLAGIWQELLGVERIGIHDNFFELGGHSLLAMRVISFIRRELEVELAIKDLFINPSIATLATHIQSRDNGLLLPPIQKQPRPELIPLSFSQERLYFIDRLEGSIQYHVPAVIRLTGKLDFTALNHALQTIVHRHEALRTVIHENHGQGYQEIIEHASWEIDTIDGSAFHNDIELLHQKIIQLVKVPFDLAKDFMLGRP
jgi:acyl carrier protein